MSYEYLSDNELIHEIDVLEKLTEALASQAEKLARLRAEGKVGDSVYREVFEDLRRKAEVTNRKRDELLAAAEARIKQMDGEGAQLKHQNEILEVRHAIGAIPDEKYKVAHEGFLTQLTEIDEVKRRIAELINTINEASRRIGQYVPSTIVGRLQEPSISPVQPTIKPVERPTAPPPITAAATIPPPITATTPPPTLSPSIAPTVQPKAEAKPTEVRAEAPKPKVKKCSKCSAENLESASYCYNCGARLG